MEEKDWKLEESLDDFKQNDASKQNIYIINGLNHLSTEKDWSVDVEKQQLPPEVSEESSNDDVKVADVPPNEPAMSQKRIMKNLIVIGIVFFLQYVAYGSLESMQSSLHEEEGMGAITQAIMSGFAALSSLLLPKISVEILGHKWCMAVCLVLHDLWLAANGYAVWATMIPASILVGLSIGPLWTAMSCYLTLAARHYAAVGGEDPRIVTARFFGIFFGCYRLSGVFSSIISSTILSIRPENVTSPPDAELQSYCGLNDCPGTNATNSNMDEPSSTVMWALVGVACGIAAIAFIICCVFVDQVPDTWLKPQQQQDSDGDDDDVGRTKRCPPSRRQCRTVLDSLTATIRHMKNVPQLLLIPLSMYSTMEQTFFKADYAKSFVACFLGVWMVGWTKIPHAIVNTVTSLVSGKLAQLTGIYPMFIIGGCFELTFQLSLMFWVPVTSQAFMFYIIPCFNAVGEGIFKVQLTSVYATLFPRDTEAAFSNQRFWEAVGFLVAWGYSSALCTSVKLYILMSFLLLGLALLFVIYVLYVRRSKKSTSNVDDDLIIDDKIVANDTKF